MHKFYNCSASFGERLLLGLNCFFLNSGAVYHAESKTWSGLSESAACEVMAKEWMALGADIVGGCCGIGPEQIRALSKIIYQ
jgi:homocysteine S-methyltransferase